jgi:hypothetical protein
MLKEIDFDHLLAVNPCGLQTKNKDFQRPTVDDLNGSVGSIADLKPKGPGFESRISQGFFLM